MLSVIIIIGLREREGGGGLKHVYFFACIRNTFKQAFTDVQAVSTSSRVKDHPLKARGQTKSLVKKKKKKKSRDLARRFEPESRRSNARPSTSATNHLRE